MRDARGNLNGLGMTVVGVLVLLTCAVLALGSVAGCGALKGWQRGQHRADARNQVAITHINIQNAQQQADVVNAEIQATKATAEKRYQEAVGIRRAQDEVSKTLTALYIQHEAIQAQQTAAANSGDHTIVYVPSGAQGVPLVGVGTKP